MRNLDKTKNGPTLHQMVKTYPSPAPRDWRSGSGRTENGHTPQLPEVVGGQLNPMWVAWLMGWPIGATRLGPSETGKSPSPRRRRGKSSGAPE